MSVPNPAGGPALTAHVTGDAFLAGTARLIQNPAVLPSLPPTIFFAAHGGLAQVVGAVVGAPTPLSDVFAFGKTLSTLCSDIIPFETRHDRTEAAQRDSRVPQSDSGPRRVGADQSAGLRGLGRAACPGGSAPSGAQPDPDVDPERRVPTAWSRPTKASASALRLRRALFYQVPGAGHVVLTGTCASGIASQFFNDPESVPNTSCLSTTMSRAGLP